MKKESEELVEDIAVKKTKTTKKKTTTKKTVSKSKAKSSKSTTTKKVAKANEKSSSNKETKGNNTSKKAKRTLKIPSLVEEKANNNVVAEIKPELNNDDSVSKKKKRTLRLNLGKDEKNEEVVKESAKVIDITSIIENKVEESSNESQKIEESTKGFEIENEKGKILNHLLENDSTSVAIPLSSVNSDTSFLEDPSVFEKFNIGVISKDISSSSLVKSEPTINENSSFFYEPTVFSKFDIEITETEPPTSVIKFEQATETTLENNNTDNIEKNNIDEIIDIEDEDIEINDEPKSLNSLVSFDDEEETLEDIITKSLIEEEYVTDDELIPEYDGLSDDELISLFDEEDNNSNIEDINIDSLDIENIEAPLMEAAGEIETGIPTNNKTVDNFFESSVSTLVDDSLVKDKSNSSVFKKFSYEEPDVIEIKETASNTVTPISTSEQVSDIKQVLGNFEPTNNLNAINVTASSVATVTPTITTDIFPTSNNVEDNDSNFFDSILTESSTPTIDSDILDLLSDEDILNIEDDGINNQVDVQEEKVEEPEIVETVEDNIVNDENEDEELDYADENENEDVEYDDDSFSIEDYFGLNDNNIEENENEKNSQPAEDVKKTNINNEKDKKDKNDTISDKEVSSLTKLLDSFTETISSLNNRVSELENTKIQPVTSSRFNFNGIDLSETDLEGFSSSNLDLDSIEIPSPTENSVEVEDVKEDEYAEVENNVENTIEENIDDSIIEEPAQEIIDNNIDDTQDISLNDIDLNDLSIDDINIDDITLDDVDIATDNNEAEAPVSIEDILSDALSNNDIMDSDMKDQLLSEVLSEELLNNEETNVEESILPKEEAVTENQVSEKPTDDFLRTIASLTKTIAELENSPELPLIQQNSSEEIQPVTDTSKTFNILINEKDTFSISVLNETYEIVADFDGISVISENIHISTPKKNFFVKVGEKYIEIHHQENNLLVQTNFEDIEFANAINNVAFAKKDNIIELNIKEAFKLSSVNNKIELSMLNSPIAGLANSSNQNGNGEASECDNKTLLISEETQKVYLPYSIEDVMKKLNDSSNGYQTIDEVVEKEYTLPLSYFKMPIISRFREAYRFMRTKEKSSVYAAVDLALELMFNSNLNPAVIRAAKDLKELNIYLDCLYENELDKFDCFKIIYKVLPKIH